MIAKEKSKKIYRDKAVVLRDISLNELLAWQDEIIYLDPKNPMSNYDKGITLIKMKLYENAITAYKMAFTLEILFSEAIQSVSKSILHFNI